MVGRHGNFGSPRAIGSASRRGASTNSRSHAIGKVHLVVSDLGRRRKGLGRLELGPPCVVRLRARARARVRVVRVRVRVRVGVRVRVRVRVRVWVRVRVT